MARLDRIKRRMFLRGAGGVAVGLPLLEAMLSPRKAHAATGPKRYVIMFAGVEQHDATPRGSGTGYTLPRSLDSLEPVREHISLVSGLRIPSGGNNPPPGGLGNKFHHIVRGPLLTGVRGNRDFDFKGPTSEQVVADAIGSDTPFPSLHYLASPTDYGGRSELGISSKRSGSSITRNAPLVSPRQAWEQLMTSVPQTPGTGSGPASPSPADLARARAIMRRRSVLDLVLERGNRLTSVVGATDRVRLEQHFDEIRAIERRLAMVGGGGGGGGPSAACQAMTDPGADPSRQGAYSDEEARAGVFIDLIHLALTCDLTRSVAFPLTEEGNFMSTQPLWGLGNDMHQMGHDDEFGTWHEVVSWHFGFYAQLVQRLADTPEADGTLLDHTAVVFTNSGGPDSHQTSNMTLAIAGRGDAVRLGVHVSGNGRHPTQLFQTAMQAAGVDLGATPFGEVPGVIDELVR